MNPLNEEVKNRIVEAQKTIPVDIIALCKNLGIRVFEVKSWTNKMSGMIRRDADTGSYSIYVNSSHPDTRCRFTIAHELAHWILHRDLIGDGILDDGLYRSGLPTHVEVEANRFAADILMPKRRIHDEWQKPDSDLASMAVLFDVSKAAMAIRLGVPI